jgi:hypothetical protein
MPVDASGVIPICASTVALPVEPAAVVPIEDEPLVVSVVLQAASAKAMTPPSNMVCIFFIAMLLGVEAGRCSVHAHGCPDPSACSWHAQRRQWWLTVGDWLSGRLPNC